MINKQKVVRKLYRALDALLDTETECRTMGKDSTFSEAISRLHSLISFFEND